MKKAKQICALIGVILLVALYVSTLIFALIGSDDAIIMLEISVFLTIVVPALIWIMGMIAKVLNKYYSTDSKEENNKTNHK